MTTSIGRRPIVAALLGAAFGAPAIALAADYPDRPIHLIVGFPPGGGADYVARQTAAALGQALGASVVVDNRPGANGAIGAAEVARATAGGYTLLLGVAASQSISPALGAKLSYDPLRDFTPISMVGYTPLVLVVNPRLPVKTVAEFIRYVNDSRAPITYGSAGVGNITHMAAEMFAQATGVKMQHIPYKGSAPVITDLLGGQITAYFDTLPSSLPFIRGGQLRALAVTGAERASAAPDIPTMQEAGIAKYEASNWFGLLAPPKLAPELATKLADALRQSLGAPDARKEMTSRGVEPVLNAPAQFTAELEADLTRWREVTRKANITLE